jgi:hypothetical protein
MMVREAMKGETCERVKEGRKNGSGSYIRMVEETGKMCFMVGGV